MSNPTTMSYGMYDFSPVPFMRLSRTPNKTGAGEILGFTWGIGLNGDLVAPTGNILTIDAMQDELASGLEIQGQLFEVGCGGTPFLSAYPKINSLTFDEGVWVNTCKYSVEMEFDEIADPSGAYISDFSEDWSFNFEDEKTGFSWTVNGSPDTLPIQAKLTHNISATGKSIYHAGVLVKPAWQQAREYIKTRLNLDEQFIENSGIINLDVLYYNELQRYNHFRTTNTNESAGTFSVNDSWLIINSGDGIAGAAIEDYTISVRTASDTGLKSVGIQGSIQGLERRVYLLNPGDFEVTQQKYDNAEAYWDVVKDIVYHRANLILNNTFGSGTLNTIPLSTDVSHNTYNGSISYNYEYNDRPSNCIAGALTENFTITYNNPAEVWARIFVLGRANGPVLQELNTKTERTVNLSIEATFPIVAGCTILAFTTFQGSGPETYVNTLESELEGIYSQVGRVEDNEVFNPKSGNYSRQVTWLAGNC